MTTGKIEKIKNPKQPVVSTGFALSGTYSSILVFSIIF
jgi:hypothetical protein